MIKIKNVDPKSVLCQYSLNVVGISSCDTKIIVVPFSGYLNSLQVGTTAATVAGQHWVITNKFNSKVTLDVSQTLAAALSGAQIFPATKNIFISAGSLLGVNVSSTANFAPYATLVLTKSDKSVK